MTPKELEKIGVELYGSLGWRKKLAEALNIHRNTIYRWMTTGDIPMQWASYVKLFYETEMKKREVEAQPPG